MKNQSNKTLAGRVRNRNGFTIIELLVVVALIALLIGFSVPVVFKIDEAGRDRSGVNTFGVAVTAARAYATRKIADDDSNPQASYSGAAIVVTTFNELRLVGDIQEQGFEPRNVYKDIIRTEYIALPRGTGVAGIGRSTAGLAGFKLLPPPFAIKFDERGHLASAIDTTTANNENTVFYDMNLDGTTAVTTRPANYNPNTYDPDVNTIVIDQASGRYKANTFEALETVVGVVVYSKADFEDAGGAWPTTAPDFGCTGGCGTGVAGVNKWMLENGRVLYFSRFTGQIIRQNAP